MAAKRAKKGNAVKPLENENISKVIKALEKVQNKGKWQNSKLKQKAAEEAGQEEEKSTIAAEEDFTAGIGLYALGENVEYIENKFIMFSSF